MWAVAALGLFGLLACDEDACVASVRLPILVAIGVAATVLALRIVVALAPRNVVECEAVPLVAEREFNLLHGGTVLQSLFHGIREVVQSSLGFTPFGNNGPGGIDMGLNVEYRGGNKVYAIASSSTLFDFSAQRAITASCIAISFTIKQGDLSLADSASIARKRFVMSSSVILCPLSFQNTLYGGDHRHRICSLSPQHRSYG